jgi:hypothetical protein
MKMRAAGSGKTNCSTEEVERDLEERAGLFSPLGTCSDGGWG